jgi:HAD superfamily hydrolase (TIGR01509 family)
VFQATLFDYNGVLVDDELVHWEAFCDVLAPLGIRISESEYWQDYLGLDDAGVFRTVLQRFGKAHDESSVSGFVEAKKPRYLARARGALRGFPGAAELVREQASRGPVVIVSGALRDEIELGLEVLGVRDQVQAIISAEDAPRCKPDPQGYHKGISALERLGVTDVRAQGIVFEDSVDGIAAALAAGLTTIAIAHSYPKERLEHTGAQRVVERIGDVNAKLLSELFDEVAVQKR